MPDTREREASTGRDIASGQFKPKGPGSGGLLPLMVGPNSTEEALIWGILAKAAPSASKTLRQVMRYGTASVQSIRGSEGGGSGQAR